MTNTRHTTPGDNLAHILREAMGPGYQAPTIARAFEQQLNRPVCCSPHSA